MSKEDMTLSRNCRNNKKQSSGGLGSLKENSMSNPRMILQTVKSWALVAASTSVLIMFIIYGSFQAAYFFHPILDVSGGNLDNMELNQKIYSPGDMIIVRFKMQKQRPV